MAHVSELTSDVGTTHSASYVQDGVGVGRVLLQQFDGLFRTRDEQFNFATLGGPDVISPEPVSGQCDKRTLLGALCPVQRFK